MIKKQRLRTWTIFSGILCALSHLAEAAEADVYTEDQFVTAALEASLSLVSAKNQLAAAKLDEKQVDLQTAPQLSSSLSSINDRNPSTMTTPSYSSLSGTEYNLGVSQQFRYGTKAKLGFSLKNNTLRDVTIAPSPSSSDLDTSVFAPTIEVSQSLLQNGFGRALSLQRELLARQSDGQSSELLIRQQAVTLEAKLAYYRLAFMRDRVATARSTLDTAQKILQFVTAKVHNNLYEKGDLLQTEALVESRKIELKSAIMEQTSAEIAFNSLRGSCRSFKSFIGKSA